MKTPDQFNRRERKERREKPCLVFVLFAFFAVNSSAATADALVKPFREVTVSSVVAGTLRTLAVKEGETVKQGQALAVLANEQEQIEVERLTKVLEKRDFDDRGTAKLFKDNVVSEDEAVEKRIEREIAELQLRRAKVDLAQKTVLAPLDGVVVAKKREAGEWVEPGTVVFEIVNIDRVYAELLVTPEEAAPLKTGQKLTTRFALLGAKGDIEGTIDFIDPRVDASSGLMKIRILIENPQHRLRPGYRGQALLP